MSFRLSWVRGTRRNACAAAAGVRPSRPDALADVATCPSGTSAGGVTCEDRGVPADRAGHRRVRRGTASAATAAMAAMAAVRLELVTSGHASLAPMGGYTASDAARVATPSAVCRVSHRDRRARVASFSALAAAPPLRRPSRCRRCPGPPRPGKSGRARKSGKCCATVLPRRPVSLKRPPIGVAVSDARPRGHGGGGTDRMSAIHTRSRPRAPSAARHRARRPIRPRRPAPAQRLSRVERREEIVWSTSPQRMASATPTSRAGAAHSLRSCREQA
jgi:hypothetical protein